MQRSSSSSRVGDQETVIKNSSNTSISLYTVDNDQQRLLRQHQQLPTYDPLSHVAKKERSRLRSAENAIHLIPLVLVLCAIILWFFSNPESRV